MSVTEILRQLTYSEVVNCRLHTAVVVERGRAAMSYGVHIERFDAQGSHGITLEEWLAYVRSDQEMHHIGEAVIKTSKGDTVRYDAPGMTEWIDPQTGHRSLFDHRKIKGTVSVGNPSREVLVKMFKVAKALGAVVQGDQGEYYDASGNPIRSK
jgi:hypothetical protein